MARSLAGTRRGVYSFRCRSLFAYGDSFHRQHLRSIPSTQLTVVPAARPLPQPLSRLQERGAEQNMRTEYCFLTSSPPPVSGEDLGGGAGCTACWLTNHALLSNNIL